MVQPSNLVMNLLSHFQVNRLHVKEPQVIKNDLTLPLHVEYGLVL